LWGAEQAALMKHIHGRTVGLQAQAAQRHAMRYDPAETYAAPRSQWSHSPYLQLHALLQQHRVSRPAARLGPAAASATRVVCGNP
jgi:hypothetical protein